MARLAPCLSGQVRAAHTGQVPAVRKDTSAVRPFDEIPGQWRNSVANLYTLWRMDGLKKIHRIMLHNFNVYGLEVCYPTRTRGSRNTVGFRVNV